MAESNSSFIPKRSNTTNRQAPRRSNFFVFSIVSYALFVAAPIASGVVFIYEKYAEKQFAQSVINLDAAIRSFSDADMERVSEFDERLVIADMLLDTHVSFSSLFSILESSTAATVQFNNLDITRVSPETITVSAGMSADAFDALLFQRSVYSKNEKITKSTFNNVTFAGAIPTEGGQSSSQQSAAPESKLLSLEADFIFSAENILFNPVVTQSTDVPNNIAEDTIEVSGVENNSTSSAVNEIPL